MAHNNSDKWGCFDIIEPVTISAANRNSTYYDTLTKATQVVAMFNPSTGSWPNGDCISDEYPYMCCTGLDTGTCTIKNVLDQQRSAPSSGYEKDPNPDNWCTGVDYPYDCFTGYQTGPCVGDKWVPQDIVGMWIYDPDNDKYITNCGHDWYNVSNTDHPSLCWGDLSDAGATAKGAWGRGTNSDDHELPDEAHAQRVSWYLGEIPQDWANAHLAASGTQMCYAGMYRIVSVSAGPTLFAFPCAQPGDEDTSNMLNQSPIAATPLISYHTVNPIRVSGYGAAFEYEKHTPATQCRDSVWIDAANDLVAFNCQVGGPYWWYGQAKPWEDCDAHRNNWGSNTPKRYLHHWNQINATLDVALTGEAETSVVINDTVANLCTVGDAYVPQSSGANFLKITEDDETVRNQYYTGYSGDTFTISSANYTSPNSAAIGNSSKIYCCMTGRGDGNDDDAVGEFGSYGPDIPVGMTEDTCVSSKGYHSIYDSTPKRLHEVQFYDADDLADVAAGLKNPWEVVPAYELTISPGASGPAWGYCGQVRGLTFDGTYLYVAEATNSAERLIIHVYEFTGTGDPPPSGADEGVQMVGTAAAGADTQ
jgi:hypothetical protein